MGNRRRDFLGTTGLSGALAGAPALLAVNHARADGDRISCGIEKLAALNFTLA
jgi:hypothetical protein